MQLKGRPWSLSIRQLLVLSGVAALLPVVLVGAYALVDLTSRDQQVQREHLRETVSSLRAAVDREWETLERKAKLLAGSRQISAMDADAARELLTDAARVSGEAFLLLERIGAVPNTLVSTSGALTLMLDAEVATNLPDRGRVVITSAALAQDGKPIAALLTPVTATRTLAVVPGRRHFEPILKSVVLPAGWVAAIDDPDNVIVARSEQADEFVGTKARLRSLPGTAEIVSFVDLQGRPAIMAHNTSGKTKYRAVVWAPADVFYASSARLRRWLASLATAALLFGLAAALGTSALISRPILQLARAAQDLQKGNCVEQRHTLMSEANSVSATLTHAATAIATRESKLQRETERTRFLIRELAHRLKNQMAVILAIARQTAKSDSPDTFVKQFEGRMSGLARSVELLVHRDWNGVPITELVDGQLAAFDDPHRIRRTGSEIMLSAEATQALGLALHELATNAIKHGALSVPSGSVTVEWRVDATEFELVWAEKGGPVVSPPQRRGFGRTIIEQMVAAQLSGKSELRFNPDGLVWFLRTPAAAIEMPQARHDPALGAG